MDIPIGLLDAAKRGGRDCDIEARKRLGSRRGSSVFPPPVRATLDSDDYAEANVINHASSDVGIGLSKQCYSIIPKIREVDQFINPDLQERVKEVHPEICFWKMADGVAMNFSKKKSQRLP